MTDGPSTPPPFPGGNSSLVTRAINVVTKPGSEWPAIEAEASSNGKLITYAAILAVLAPIFGLVGLLLTPFGSYIFSNIGFLIKALVILYVIALLPPILLGFALDALTPSLGGTKNSLNAMKLAIYSGTGFWLGAVGLILSGWLWLLIGAGLAGYLLWVGTPILMKTPSDKTPIFVGAGVGILVVLYIILDQIGTRIMLSGLYGGIM